jgi:hypothetical protein
MTDLRALSRGKLIILVAGVLLFVDSFLAWQKVSIEFAGITAVSVSKNLWDSAGGALAGLALVALLAWIVLRAANVDFTAKVSDRAVIGSLAAVVAILVLLKNLLDDYSAWPSYVGVVLAGVVFFGAWLHLREQREVTAASPAPAEPA